MLGKSVSDEGVGDGLPVCLEAVNNNRFINVYSRADDNYCFPIKINCKTLYIFGLHMHSYNLYYKYIFFFTDKDINNFVKICKLDKLHIC